MHTQSLDRWKHSHAFLGDKHVENERKTWLVVLLTAAMMVVEIVGGVFYGSMALVADGWHMSTHAGALAISAFAYRYARTHAHDPRFTFGTGKLSELAGYTSALILVMIALIIGYESGLRLLNPVAIGFDEAIAIAVVGLGVNLASAWLLRDDHAHGHHHPQHHHGPGHHHHHHHDHNMRSAYLHVIADAFTSVLAIVALLAGKFYGLSWMDPVMGIVGALVIARWSVTLVRSAGAVLLDAVPDSGLASEIRKRLEVGTDRVSDLHLWRVGPGHMAVIVSLVADEPMPPNSYKDRLNGIDRLSHVTIEVQPCTARSA